MIREHLLWGDISSKGLHRLIKYSPPLLGCIKYKIIYVYSPRLLGCIKYTIIYVYVFALSSSSVLKYLHEDLNFFLKTLMNLKNFFA